MSCVFIQKGSTSHFAGFGFCGSLNLICVPEKLCHYKNICILESHYKVIEKSILQKRMMARNIWKFKKGPYITISLPNSLTHLFPMHPFSTAWKHQKTLRFSDVFRGQRKSALGTNGLRKNCLLVLSWLSFP